MYMREQFANTDAINGLINHLKTTRNQFDMSSWDTCICGHLARMNKDSILDYESPIRYGARHLGITEEAAGDLFAVRLGDRKQAIKCLEILRDEGVVSWARACA